MPSKRSSTDNHARIAFNWEKVKKTASQKIDELKCNAPKISRREEMQLLERQAKRIRPEDSFIRVESRPEFNHIPTLDSDGNELDCTVKSSNVESRIQTNSREAERISNIDTGKGTDNGTDRSVIGNDTHEPSLLARPSAQGREDISREDNAPVPTTTARDIVCGEDILGPDRNAIELLKEIGEGRLRGSDLEQDERRLVVAAMRKQGQTQDSIAQVLRVSRRTIVSDCKHLRQMAALEIARVDTLEIAGEVYATAKVAIQRALKKGHLKTVSTVMRDMVELLQSMGIVYRAPKTSMQANLNASVTGKQHGFQKYMEAIGNDDKKVVEVLDCLFDTIQRGDLPQ